MKPLGWLLLGGGAALAALASLRPERYNQPAMSLVNNARLKLLHPSILPSALGFIEAARQHGISLLVVSGYRSLEEQAKLYAQGRTAPGPIVTQAKPGSSWHNYGLAFDIVPIDPQGRPQWTAPEATWRLLGELGEQHGLTWGGRWEKFPDRPHFQRTAGLTLAQAAAGQRPEPPPSVAGETLRSAAKDEPQGALASAPGIDNDDEKTPLA